MSLIVFLVIGLVAILAIWWVRIDDPPAKKAREIGLSLVGATAFAVVFIVAIYELCSWVSVNIGGQPLRM